MQAKGGSDALTAVQIGEDFALCTHHFPDLISRPIAAQFLAQDLIALFDFELANERVTILSERHYRLVYDEDLTAEEIAVYRDRPDA